MILMFCFIVITQKYESKTYEKTYQIQFFHLILPKNQVKSQFDQFGRSFNKINFSLKPKVCCIPICRKFQALVWKCK